MLLKIAELFACCRMLQHNLPSEPLLQASFVVLRSSYGKLAPQSNNIPLAAIVSDIKMWYDVNCTTRDPVERCVSCAKMNQFARMLFAGSARSYTKWCKCHGDLPFLHVWTFFAGCIAGSSSVAVSGSDGTHNAEGLG